MICFFALQPDTVTRRQIADWRDRNLPPTEHPVAGANLHITLLYLGETADWQLDQLLNATDYGELSPINLTLDQMGYWPKPRVLWLGCTQVPDVLHRLVRQLNRSAGSLRLQRDRHPYVPHLTLARKLTHPPPAATEAPYFPMQFREFVLMQTRRSATGVNYQVVERFK